MCATNSGCDKIVKVTSNAPEAYRISNTVFASVNYDNCVLYVPEGTADDYANRDYWSNFTNIMESMAPYFDVTNADGTVSHIYIRNDGSTVTLGDNVKTIFVEKELTANEFAYVRTFNNTNWQPLYVPFEMSYSDWKDDFEVAYVNNFHQYDTNEDGIIDKAQMEIIKVKNGSIYANRPYLIRAKVAGLKTLNLNNVTLRPTEVNSVECSSATMRYTFTGTYDEVKGLNSKGYYIMAGGALCQVDNDDVALKPFRWYMEMEDKEGMVNYGGGAMAKIMSIEIVEAEEDDATGIVATPKAEDAEDNSIYDMSGRKVSDSDVNALSKGMYIKNNKKFIVK